MANSQTTSIEQHTIHLGRVAGRDVTITLNRIPACTDGFLMGSRGYSSQEEPIHRVVIPEDFWIAATPTTQAQFEIWTQAAGIEHKNHFAGNPNHPAECINWNQAYDYCDWLTETRAAQLPTDHRIATLPTEAHWEYACRAHTTTEYHSGDGEATLRQAGRFGEERREGCTHAVGELRQNDFGLHDMHGNVWEWCLDRWDSAAYRRRFDGIRVQQRLP